MTEEMTQQFLSTASRLAAATEALEQTLTRLDADHAGLNSKIERIIAAIESEAGDSRESAENPQRLKQLEARIAELERANADLRAQASRAHGNAARKTLPPMVTALLAKSGLDQQERIDPAVLDKTLTALSVEQRIAVKAQMARAGIID